MYEPPSEQGDDTGYDVTNKGSRLAGTIGMHRPRHNERLSDQERPTDSSHREIHSFGNSTLVVQQLAFLGGSVEFTVLRDFYRLSGT